MLWLLKGVPIVVKASVSMLWHSMLTLMWYACIFHIISEEVDNELIRYWPVTLQQYHIHQHIFLRGNKKETTVIIPFLDGKLCVV